MLNKYEGIVLKARDYGESHQILTVYTKNQGKVSFMARGSKKTKSRFLTMAEACDYLKVSRGTMTKRLSDGEINFATKRGKSWLFPEEKLKAYASGMA